MPYTYPPAAPTLSGDVLSINRFLQNPTLVARRLRTLAEQRFISDSILSQRIPAPGGSVLYETGEDIYTDTAPLGVAPGAEYPRTSVSHGTASLAKTTKWGSDVEVTDEAISRQLINPVERAFEKLVNHMVKTVDGVAMSAVNSAVTQTTAASASWSSSSAVILRDVLLAKARVAKLNQGFDPDTLVVDDETYAHFLSDSTISNLWPRETSATPVQSGSWPLIAGLRVLVSPHVQGGGTSNAIAMVLDSRALGGMADENLSGPGYVSTNGVGVQAKTIRQDEADKWLLRCRRITVPIVLEPAAAWKITGVAAAAGS
jgi:hypothetical protein